MHLREAWTWPVLAAAVVSMAVPPLRASPDDREPLRRVELMLVGRAGKDPTLEARVRSLFGPESRVVTSRVPRLEPMAVLEPVSAEAVYLWITLGPDRARVYVVVREQHGQGPRFLFRDVELERGMDEVESETLAQVAHSSAAALWSGGNETSKQELESELAREFEPADEDERTGKAPTLAAEPPQRQGAARRQPTSKASGAHPRDDAASRARRARRNDASRRFAFGIGVQQAEHLSGDEGRFDEPGGFAALAWKDALALRLLGSYVMPARFAAGAAEVRRSGASSDVRVACLLFPASGPRARLELGAGILLVNWSPAVESPARQGPAGRDRRGYGVGAVAGELPLGPFRAGVRLELRVPFRETVYDWQTTRGASTVAGSWLSPGAAIELGLPLTRF